MLKNLLKSFSPCLLGLALATAVVWPSPALARSGLKVWEASRDQVISLEAAVVVSARARLITVGELHDQLSHHLAQAAVIKAYHTAKIPLAVGLEMWRQTDQAALDDWLNGKLDESQMAQALKRNWSRSWPLYREIFLYCRDNGLDMVALNLDREVTRKVAAKGYGALSEAEKQTVPPLKCELESAYKTYLQEIFDKHISQMKAHAKKGGAKPSQGHGDKFKKSHGRAVDFNSFCLAQVAWDAGMAWRAVKYLKANPQKSLVVITGLTHAARAAIPFQAARLDPGLGAVVFQPEVSGHYDRAEAKKDRADFLILNPEEALGGSDAQRGADDRPI